MDSKKTLAGQRFEAGTGLIYVVVGMQGNGEPIVDFRGATHWTHEELLDPQIMTRIPSPSESVGEPARMPWVECGLPCSKGHPCRNKKGHRSLETCDGATGAPAELPKPPACSRCSKAPDERGLGRAGLCWTCAQYDEAVTADRQREIDHSQWARRREPVKSVPVGDPWRELGNSMAGRYVASVERHVRVRGK